MKRITILNVVLLAGATAENGNQPVLAYPGSTIDVDDNTAGLLVVSGKARYDKDAKAKDTSKARLAEIDALAAKSAQSPEATMAALIGAAVQAALASKPTATA